MTDAELDHRAEVARIDGNYLALELIHELRQLHTITPPPRVQVGMDSPPDDGRRAMTRATTPHREGKEGE